MDPPGGLTAPTPDIQGYNGTTAIQTLKADLVVQYLSGSTGTGTATTSLTVDGTSTGTPMFSAIPTNSQYSSSSCRLGCSVLPWLHSDTCFLDGTDTLNTSEITCENFRGDHPEIIHFVCYIM